MSISLFDARHGQCRFIVKDATRDEPTQVCGEPCDGSWCKKHRALVFDRSRGPSLFLGKPIRRHVR
jgi:hypothetical protein